ncbi:hypothetical protein [Paraconexibacter sp.]|uniref:hypothetical protein n=1 Tax=Paraconexibacter sp. TaxID=2949640 RepID=UPI003564CDE5
MPTRSDMRTPGGTSEFPFQMALLMVTVPAVLLLLGLVLDTGPLTVIGMALLVLAFLFLGLGSLMRRRALDRKPDRDPVPPPSA